MPPSDTTDTPLLQVEHLRKRFGNQLVLDDISFTADKGEIVSLIGESGGGKSVILKNIIGLLVPDGGRILFKGQVIASPHLRPQDTRHLRRHFGMLFQGAALFDSKNVGENIAFPLREHSDRTEEQINETVADALQKVGLKKEFAEKMPSELSGGMKSRVGLARALVMEPEIMLYDEPTSALDPIMTDKINDLILSLRKQLNMTSLIITHDLASSYKISDRIIMLYKGKSIFSGTPAEIRASRNPYIQQFIRGQRKLHYATQDQEGYERPIDLDTVKKDSQKFDPRALRRDASG
jgi:phospholipid/cholesterol/gamma-HCH transport system ATP-binding protein